MTVEAIFSTGTEKMEKAIGQMKKEFASIRTGRANPLILDKVIVEYYGAPTPLRQLSQVSVQDGTTLVIAPFDKSIIKDVEKALIKEKKFVKTLKKFVKIQKLQFVISDVI